ncbi:glycosyl transferase, WecB/TagA/CpsF family [Thermoanaerobacterium xylanolyticum LX-11]|uniref:N-acetylglucosaminyldiphosphoundecaprenol N-acetyl-beta-D-mannosaminyltransferase n=1 Tax=Thermoanaerobacterium xylanolyticum (strain ATCC 49914 / DSM 7097 / LX-11) TaxID=858215 RepID=F6BH34_THEXL|nr:WecB/TagA/CpsF family glycosyltransferase [Thermoanaerobacterium xylanolyticum]AEF16478.1 glycosyl transferase, WecB/TagA/CpsF family [Thermoanaerobacterium xylanolyticum LX-11]
MAERFVIFDVPIDKVNMKQAVDTVEKFLSEDRLHMVATPNAEIVMMAQKDPEYKEILNKTDLNVPDGSGVIFASKIYKEELPERVAGFDLMMELIKVASAKKYKIYLLGAKSDVVKAAYLNLKRQYSEIDIVGFHDGYFSKDDEDEIIHDINEKNTDLLFVALGAPKQEKWIYENRNKLKAKVAIGVGGSFDVIAGKVTRAPEIYRKLGLEWFYRLLKEPWRYKRMMALPKFAVKVLFSKKPK